MYAHELDRFFLTFTCRYPKGLKTPAPQGGMDSELNPKPVTQMNTEEIIGWLISHRRLTVLRSALNPQTATELCEIYRAIANDYPDFTVFCDPLITLLPYHPNADKVYRFMVSDDCKDGCIEVLDALTMYLFTQLNHIHPYYLIVTSLVSHSFRLGNIIIHFDRDKKSYWIERV